MGSDTYRGYNGYIITREGHSLLFGGDTARTSAFAGYRVYGPFDAAIMPIGAYRSMDRLSLHARTVGGHGERRWRAAVRTDSSQDVSVERRAVQ